MISKNLKLLRMLYDLSQEDMALLLKVSVATYCRKENGKQEFLLCEARLVANKFNRSIEDIFYNPTLLNCR